MVILLVAVGEAFLPQLFTEFTVGIDESCTASRQRVVLEDIRHVVEQPRHSKEHLRRCQSTLSFQKALRVAVSLLCRQRQPLDAFILVLVDDLTLEK